eukprot:TRINITY_DN8858_c0_g1_i1.p1 TRINITY_DN8858_c0_g1~~TRINITY_DN8858_c0_g1_i1.p1  ORF type:complete len:363 (+),score=48.52 TRINITY_DN8858_c0_g1_i1:289-1377(+)
MSKRQTRSSQRKVQSAQDMTEVEQKKAKTHHTPTESGEYEQPMDEELVAWLNKEKVIDATPFLKENGYVTLEVVRLLTESKIKAFKLHPEGLELRFLKAFQRLIDADQTSKFLDINRSPADLKKVPSQKPRRCDNCHKLDVVKHRNSITGYHCRSCTSLLLCGDSRRHRAEAARIREEDKKTKKEQKAAEKKQKQDLKEQFHELLKVPHCPTYNEFQAEHFPTISAHLRHKLGVERFQHIELDVIDKLSSIWTIYRKEVKLCAKIMAAIKQELIGKHFDSEESKNAFIRKRKQELLNPRHNLDFLFKPAVIVNEVEKEFKDLAPVLSQTSAPTTDNTLVASSSLGHPTSSTSMEIIVWKPHY